MRRTPQQLFGKTWRLAGALLMVAGLAFGGSAPAATATEAVSAPTLRTSNARSPLPLYNADTISIGNVTVKSVQRTKDMGGIRADSFAVSAVTPPQVGWYQIEHDNATRDRSAVSETAVKFDMSQLDKLDRKVEKAILRFDEAPQRWTSGSGAEQYKEGCVANLGIVTTEWADKSITALFPNDHYTSAKDGSSRAWEVTRHVRRQLASPNNASLRYGYVLQGAMSLNNLNADDNTSCNSFVSNFRLDVTLEPEEEQAPAPPPPPPPPPMPDLSIARVTGPAALAIGETAEYEIAIWNDGIPVKDQTLLQINRAGPIQLVEVVEVTSNGFTCMANLYGFGCTGSLGGDDDLLGTRGALFRVQVRGDGAGEANLIASANHGRTFEEKTVDNNLKLFEIAVQ